MSYGTCDICKCTDERPCSRGCVWSDSDHNLCSRCEAAIDAAIAWEMSQTLAEKAFDSAREDHDKLVAALHLTDLVRLTHDGKIYAIARGYPDIVVRQMDSKPKRQVT